MTRPSDECIKECGWQGRLGRAGGYYRVYEDNLEEFPHNMKAQVWYGIEKFCPICGRKAVEEE